METRREITGIRPGIMSVTVIFAALCLTVFAVLSLMTAKNEANQAEKAVTALTEYYEADGQCAAFIRGLYRLWKSGADLQELKEEAEEQGGACREGDGVLTVNYTSVIDNARQIDISVEIGGSFEVVKWQTVSRGDWTPDEKLNLWDGE
ncbi:MAG TPA: hypothetical protein GXZ52_02660 [Clostridiales bacterium]|nr:hypothetical protein [Clostridiales bacterium]